MRDAFMVCVEVPKARFSPDLAQQITQRIKAETSEWGPLDVVVSPKQGEETIVITYPPQDADDAQRDAARALEARLVELEALAQDVTEAVLERQEARR